MEHESFTRLNELFRKNGDVTIDEIAKHFSVPEQIVKTWLDDLKIYDEKIVEFRKGKYGLTRPLDLLNYQEIWQQLPLATQDKIDAVNIYTSLNSTNEYLRKIPLNPVKAIICLAEHQSGGRGRRGKQWFSPLGQNIYLSCLLRCRVNPHKLGLVSLVSGIAIVEALRSFGADYLKIKWPNDIYWRDKKLAGVLIETREIKEENSALVIGVGLNVHMKEFDSVQIDQAWTALNQVLNTPVSRNQVAAQLIHQIVQKLQMFERQGFSVFKDTWQEYDYLLGKQVSIKGSSQDLIGIALGINEAGELQLQTEGRMQSVMAGEISVRSIESGKH